MRARNWIILGAALAVVIVAGLVFKPWLLFVDVRVDEALPTAVAVPDEPVATESAAPTPVGPVALSAGSFTSHEHETSGTATIVENPDGTRVLALSDLATSNGPDVHVWLSASDVVEGTDGWYVAGGADFVDLGLIKGNLGNHVYEIPADIELSRYPSVYLWCAQFAVSFGAAQLV